MCDENFDTLNARDTNKLKYSFSRYLSSLSPLLSCHDLSQVIFLADENDK